MRAAGRLEGEKAVGGRWGQHFPAVFHLAGKAFQVAFGLLSGLIFTDQLCRAAHAVPSLPWAPPVPPFLPVYSAHSQELVFAAPRPQGQWNQA